MAVMNSKLTWMPDRYGSGDNIITALFAPIVKPVIHGIGKFVGGLLKRTFLCDIVRALELTFVESDFQRQGLILASHSYLFNEAGCAVIGVTGVREGVAAITHSKTRMGDVNWMAMMANNAVHGQASDGSRIWQAALGLIPVEEIWSRASVVAEDVDVRLDEEAQIAWVEVSL